MSRHECNCEYCEYYEDESSGISEVLQSIDDPVLMALWTLRNSVTGQDRKLVNAEIKKHMIQLRVDIAERMSAR